LKARIGFAIGAGLVTGAVALVLVRVITGEWGLGFVAGILVWLVVTAIFWNKQKKQRR
jgi:Na+/melibiose symporter-like transporter